MVIKDIWEKGKMVVTWIRGHQALTAKFGKLTRKAHLLPGESGLQKDGTRGLVQLYEMYATRSWHPELAMAGMRVLSQVIYASSCERNWSAHGHIHTNIRNRLEPATTDKLVYVYSNSKMVAATRDVDELKMFAWDNEDA